MEIGSRIHHFIITSIRPIPELNAKLWEFRHETTGTELVWLDRADENKAFGIAFKTIPEDSTGVFHILEHSVLCGSDKYPVKEPFVELLKSSVNTFLNAFTYPDKTVYPISSRNDMDFLNLVDVYMDAVLHPAIYHKPEIFRQEGWRYELREGQPPVYQGVVFNEMKGAYASADAVLEHAMNRLMFPDNCYSAESGGHPEHIPDLSYEQFIACHQKFYHPSNARIFLCGSVALDPVLERIHSFLAPYDRLEADFDIPMQSSVPYQEAVIPYEIGAEESPENRTIVCCGLMLGRYDEQEKLYAAAVLKDYLAGDNDAPLKAAILGAGLGQDVKVHLHEQMQQNWLSWEVWNTDEDKLAAIKETVRSVLEQIVRQGLDQQRLEACFNRFAFQLRDRDSGWLPRSLGEGLSMLDSWLYGGDPALYLMVEDVLNALDAKRATGYFEELLESLFLNNPHTAMTILTPSGTLGQQKQEQETARVASECAAWSEADKARIGEENRVLTLWQQTPDSPEALASMPVLKLEDIDAVPRALPVTVSEGKGLSVLTHETDDGLVYLNLHFDMSDFSMEELPAAALLSELLGKLPTAHYSGEELQMRTKQKIGKLSFGPNVYSGEDTKLTLSGKMVCLAQQRQDAVELVCEILNHTVFTDRNLLKNLLNQTMMRLQMEFVAAGHVYAMTAASAMCDSSAAAMEQLRGGSYISWIKSCCAMDDPALDGLLERLERLAKRVFVRSRLTVGVSANASELAETAAGAFLEGASSGAAAYVPNSVKQLGLPIPAPVGFAAKASSTKKHGGRLNGSVHVLANILNFSYLWNEIRVQGGAYGCGFSGSDEGNLAFYTYRDPQPGRSLGIFDNAAAFIRDYCAGEPDLTPMILGALASVDPLLNTGRRIALAESRYFEGRTHEDVCRSRHELIHTTNSCLLALTKALEDTAADNAVCVVAGNALLDSCGNLLSEKRQIL